MGEAGSEGGAATAAPAARAHARAGAGATTGIGGGLCGVRSWLAGAVTCDAAWQNVISRAPQIYKPAEEGQGGGEGGEAGADDKKRPREKGKKADEDGEKSKRAWKDFMSRPRHR